MARLNDDWIVSSHGPVEEIDSGLLTVQGTIKMPLGNFPRRMTVVGLQSGGTAIWSPMAIATEGLERIETLGQPRFLLVPNAHHRLDLRAWKKRYPAARVIAPAGAMTEIAEACPVDGDAALLKDTQAELVHVAGTAKAELAFRVVRDGKLTIIVNDVIAHVTRPPGLVAALMARVMGFGVRRPQVPRVVQSALVQDPTALADQFQSWAEEQGLRRIIPSHGEIIEDAVLALRDLSARLRS